MTDSLQCTATTISRSVTVCREQADLLHRNLGMEITTGRLQRGDVKHGLTVKADTLPAPTRGARVH